MKNSQNLMKKCPRCGEKCFSVQKKCDYCGLVFERLNYVTNKAGKIAVIKRQKEKVLRVTTWPSDVKKWKAMLFCGLGGLVGAHNFYLGRFLKGFFSLIVTLIGLVCILFENYINYAPFYEAFFFLPTAITFILWIYDFIMIFFERYKIPVAIEEVKDI